MTIRPVSLEVTTPTATTIEPVGHAVGSFEEPDQFPSFPAITEGNFR